MKPKVTAEETPSPLSSNPKHQINKEPSKRDAYRDECNSEKKKRERVTEDLKPLEGLYPRINPIWFLCKRAILYRKELSGMKIRNLMRTSKRQRCRKGNQKSWNTIR